MGDDGLLELKCPREDTHLLYLARGVLPTDYKAQVQGQLWVTGRAWVDFMSYCPELPPFLIRVEPDPTFQAALDDHIPTFHAELMAGRERLLVEGRDALGEAVTRRAAHEQSAVVHRPVSG